MICTTKDLLFLHSDRLGHVTNNDSNEQSPLFLLFLDCTWQLLQQYPEEFEFSETFLTTVWDSAFLPLFDTFLFNSEHDRQVALRKVRSFYSFEYLNHNFHTNFLISEAFGAAICMGLG